MKFLPLNMQKSYLSFFRIIKFFPSRLRTTLYFLVKMIFLKSRREYFSLHYTVKALLGI